MSGRTRQAPPAAVAARGEGREHEDGGDCPPRSRAPSLHPPRLTRTAHLADRPPRPPAEAECRARGRNRRTPTAMVRSAAAGADAAADGAIAVAARMKAMKAVAHDGDHDGAAVARTIPKAARKNRSGSLAAEREPKTLCPKTGFADAASAPAPAEPRPTRCARTGRSRSSRGRPPGALHRARSTAVVRLSRRAGLCTACRASTVPLRPRPRRRHRRPRSAISRGAGAGGRCADGRLPPTPTAAQTREVASIEATLNYVKNDGQKIVGTGRRRFDRDEDDRTLDYTPSSSAREASSRHHSIAKASSSPGTRPRSGLLRRAGASRRLLSGDDRPR